MRKASKLFEEAMQTHRDFYPSAQITFADESEATLGKSDFTISGNSVTEGAESSTFPLGVLAAKRINLSLLNDDDRWIDYAFYGAKIFLQTTFTLEDGTEETLDIGTFTVVTPESYGATISFTAMDDSYKTDAEYTTTLTYPVTAGEALRDSCVTCGISLLTNTFLNDDYEIPSLPTGITHRQLIGMIAMVAGGNAVFDEYNRLKILTYDLSEFEKNRLDGGQFDNGSPSYQTGDEANGGSFNPWDEGYNAEGGAFGDRGDIHVLYQFANGLTVGADDVVITGVRMTVEGKEEEGETYRTYGSDGYVLTLENQLAIGKEEELLALVGAQIVGLRFRPFAGDHISYPFAEFMDLAYVIDRKNNVYQTVITDVDFSYLGFTNFKCSADSPIRNSSIYYGNEERVVAQAQRKEEKRLSAYDLAAQQMSRLAANTLGFYFTKEQQPDGSIIVYRHDKPTLEESEVIYKSGIDGFFVSRDGGETYQNGFDQQGNAVLNILSVIGINFDWARGGTLTLGGKDNGNGREVILDANGEEVGHWDNNGLSAKKGDFSGAVTATTLTATGSGKIGCWTLNSNSLYKGSNVLGLLGNNNAYMGADGLSFSDKLIYDSSKDELTIKGTVNATGGTFDNIIVNNNITFYDTKQQLSSILSFVQYKRLNSKGQYITQQEFVMDDSLNLLNDLYAEGEIECLNLYCDNEIICESLQINDYCYLNVLEIGSFKLSISNNGNLYFYDVDYDEDLTYPLLGMGIDTEGDFVRSIVIYERTYSNAANMYVTIEGTLGRSTSSSERYKHDIRDLDIDEIRCLYDVPISVFKYNDGYINEHDERYGKEIPGFIAERIDEVLPIAVDHNEEGQAEMWNNNVMVPCLLKLIQNDKKRIDELEQRIEKLEAMIGGMA